MIARNTKFTTRVEQRWRAARARSNGIRQSRGMGNPPSPAFLSFKQTLSNPTERTGHRLRSGGLFAIRSAFARKAIPLQSLLLALFFVNVVSLITDWFGMFG